MRRQYFNFKRCIVSVVGRICLRIMSLPTDLCVHKTQTASNRYNLQTIQLGIVNLLRLMLQKIVQEICKYIFKYTYTYIL